jgi:hypothetical protein
MNSNINITAMTLALFDVATGSCFTQREIERDKLAAITSVTVVYYGQYTYETKLYLMRHFLLP